MTLINMVQSTCRRPATIPCYLRTDLGQELHPGLYQIMSRSVGVHKFYPKALCSVVVLLYLSMLPTCSILYALFLVVISPVPSC